jgi:hypothetical protein
LPPAKRPPTILTRAALGIANAHVVTTDFFAVDESTNHFGLEGLGAAVEMGDPVLGTVIDRLGSSVPRWTAVRNTADPQIDATGLTLTQSRTKSGQIREKFAYWTTISRAITCWALILDN